jgi:hypothetical protein
MSLENSERLWLDEFWPLWQCERSVDLKELEQRDIWTYPQKEAEPTDVIQTHHGQVK